MDAQTTLPVDQNWFQMIWFAAILPLLMFLKKSFRDFVIDKFFKKQDKGDVITRAEFEARHNELKEDVRAGFTDFGSKLDAHTVQARSDNRDLKEELKGDIRELKADMKEGHRDMFSKIDNFLAILTSRQ